MIGQTARLVILMTPLVLQAGDPPPAPQRQQELVRLVRLECGFCHGLRLTGGLGGPLTAEHMRARSLAYLQAVILQGLPGTAMPGWAPFIRPDEASWIAERLQEGFPE